LGDGKCRECKSVGEKLEALPGFHIEITDTPERVRVHFGGVERGENDRVIGSDSHALVHRMRVSALEQEVRFRADDEERRAHGESVQPLEIDVAAIHEVDGPGLRQNLVEDVDVVHFSIGNADKGGDVAVQVQERVHFDGGFVLAKFGPGKQGKAQVDGGRVQRVQTPINT